MRKLVVALAALGVSGTAMAWPPTTLADPYGAKSIVRNDYARVAERMEAAVAAGDRTPEVLLNLAAIRAKTSGHAGAAPLYRLVLDQPNVDLTTLSGTAWSHDLAARGLGRTQMATR